VERGYDPRDFSLVCFGGNGPLHAVELAEELGIQRIIVPFAPGVNCAYGLLVADFRCDYATTYLCRLDAIDLEDVNRAYSELEQSARDNMVSDGIAPERIMLRRTVDLRYTGQGHELEVPFDGGTITRQSLAALRSRFDAMHEQHYGFCSAGESVEIVGIRLACFGEMSKPDLPELPTTPKDAEPAVTGRRDVFHAGRFHSATVYARQRLEPGMEMRGPAIVEQKDSTTFLLPGDRARIDGFRNILIDTTGAP